MIDCGRHGRLYSCRSDEITPGRDHFHSLYGDARRSGDGFDHAGFAETDPRFSRRCDDGYGEMEWAIRGGLRTDAVLFLAIARRFIRSLWPAPGHPAFQSRTGPGLHCD